MAFFFYIIGIVTEPEGNKNNNKNPYSYTKSEECKSP